MRQIKARSIYRHFKGDYMYVIGVAKHSETLEDMSTKESCGQDQWICFYQKLIMKNIQR